MENKREAVIQHFTDQLEPKPQHNICLADLQYHWKNIVGFYNLFMERYQFKVGAKVRLKAPVKKTENNKGWHSALHYLQPWNVGVVKEVSWLDDNGGVVVSVKWQKQTYINQQKEYVEIKQKYTFCHSENDLVLFQDTDRIIQ